MIILFFFKQNTVYELRISYWSADVCSADLHESCAVDLWNRLLAAGVKPAGLGARDTLRLEAGMALYGQDMDETVTPLEAGLKWTVRLDAERGFVGRKVLEQQFAQGAIGRASCRDRVSVSVNLGGRRYIKKKKQ